MPFIGSVGGVYGYGRLPNGIASSPSILNFARTLSASTTTDVPLTLDKRELRINNQFVNSFEYTIKTTNTTLSSFNASDWFSDEVDDLSTWIIIKGDLTIDSGVVVSPGLTATSLPRRRLFTVVYCTGNLVLNGEISMTARGARHGVAPKITPAVPLRVGVGTFTKPDTTTVSNPTISATGGAGGQGTRGAPGTSGVTTNSTGGGGAGGTYNMGTTGFGLGAAGTCFSGGSGGGSAYSSFGGGSSGGSAAPNGGAGGGGQGNGGTNAGGGSGNPPGNSTSNITGGIGTGGTLIVICEGDLSGTGRCTANGVRAPERTGGTFGTSYACGGASGGGSINILYKTNTSGVTANTVTGGSIPSCQGFGGAGGAGSINKLQIP
jgi:hypothetical protein